MQYCIGLQEQVNVVGLDSGVVGHQIGPLDCFLVRVHWLNLELESGSHHQINTRPLDNAKDLIE